VRILTNTPSPEYMSLLICIVTSGCTFLLRSLLMFWLLVVAVMCFTFRPSFFFWGGGGGWEIKLFNRRTLKWSQTKYPRLLKAVFECSSHVVQRTSSQHRCWCCTWTCHWLCVTPVWIPPPKGHTCAVCLCLEAEATEKKGRIRNNTSNLWRHSCSTELVASIQFII
jgi:hypothetical protein